MSQEKVDKKKEKKLNAKRINSQKKFRKALTGIITAVVCIAIVAWIGYSVYTRQSENAPIESVSIDSSALTDYFNGLSESEE